MVLDVLASLVTNISDLSCRPSENNAQGFVEIINILPPPKKITPVITLKNSRQSFTIQNSQKIPSGFYEVNVPRNISISNGIAPSIYQVQLLSHPAFCLEPNQTHRIRLKYSLIPTSRRLWVATSSQVLGIDVDDFDEKKPSSFAPTFNLPLPPTKNDIRDTKLDKDGNLWIAYEKHIVRYSSLNLQRPSLTIETKSSIGQFAISPRNTIWVTHPTLNSVYEYSPKSSSEIIKLKEPFAISFSPTGRAWIGELATDTLVGIQYNNFNDLIRIRVLNTKNNNPEFLPAPNSITFDKKGNLWGIFGLSAIAQINSNNLSKSQDIEPLLLNILGKILRIRTMAVDENEQIWINYGNNNIARLSKNFLKQQQSPGIVPLPDNLFSLTNLKEIRSIALFNP